MLETIVPIGIGAITVLQLANLWQGRRTAAKVDSMITDSTCKERAGACRQVIDKEMDAQKRELHIVKRKLDNHLHNGNGVKYIPFNTGE